VEWLVCAIELTIFFASRDLGSVVLRRLLLGVCGLGISGILDSGLLFVVVSLLSQRIVFFSGFYI